MLSQLLLKNVWQEFLEYKINSGHLSKRDEKILKVFIENKEYLPIVNKMLSCENFTKTIGESGFSRIFANYLKHF